MTLPAPAPPEAASAAPRGLRRVLGINTGFAVNRFAEPEDWAPLVGDLGLEVVQLTADMLDPRLPAGVVARQVRRIDAACAAAGIRVTSVFTGAFTRVNHMAHPDAEVRRFWTRWFCRLADLAADLGAPGMGAHFGILTARDDRDPIRRAERRAQNIAGWHEVAAHARYRGLSFLFWEPMSISREQGETIPEARRLQDDVNRGSPLPFRLCLDVDHGDRGSPDPADTDPYAWLLAFGREAAHVHLKQTIPGEEGHHPFVAPWAEQGRIQPRMVLDALAASRAGEVELLLEPHFREREPADRGVEAALRESVAFWRAAVPRRAGT